MKPDQAEQNLRVIRTLMERSTLYRRALGPMMIWAGLVALVAAVVGWHWHVPGARGFISFWAVTCGVVVGGALWLARRQAVRDKEPFWSPATRRVTQAFLPAFVAAAIPTLLAWWWRLDITEDLVAYWAMLYGCALHAAGMFSPRALRRAGWLFIICGAIHMAYNNLSPHIAMGVIFGGLHIGGGVYLLATDKRSNAA